MFKYLIGIWRKEAGMDGIKGDSQQLGNDVCLSVNQVKDL